MDIYGKLNQKAYDVIAKKYGGYRRKTNEIITKFINESKENILDLGCGNLSYLIEYPVKIFGVDFSIESLKRVDRDNVELINADITMLPFKDNCFSKAMCLYTLHNLSPEDQIKTLKEIYRVLKDSGTCLITVWSKWQTKFLSMKNLLKLMQNKPLEIKWGDAVRYYFLFSERNLLIQCAKAGFKIEKKGQFFNGKNKNYFVVLKKEKKNL